MCFFFFSSRRRHTRLTCDWSSDVCSSDLRPQIDAREVLEEGVLDLGEGLMGDTWKARGSSRIADGSAHPDMQLNIDRKSTRLNSSHMSISYAVFCLKKKKKKTKT